MTGSITDADEQLVLAPAVVGPPLAEATLVQAAVLPPTAVVEATVLAGFLAVTAVVVDMVR